MSRVFVVGHGVHLDSSRPEFRKATRNMIWVQTALEAALGTRREAIGENLGLVLGTSHGELAVTMDFLKALAATGMARPILFQNSLHNSTAGFAALNLQITGPMLTVSGGAFTGEDTLSSAMLFLQQGLCDHCLAVAVESRVPKLETDTSNVPGEGAGALLLANEAGLNRCGWTPVAEILSLSYHRDPCDSNPEAHAGFYPSHAIELLSKSLNQSETLRLTKPDGAHSEITWRRWV